MMNAMADPRQPYWHPGWIDPDPHYRAIRREHTKRALQLAKELGAPNMHDRAGRAACAEAKRGTQAAADFLRRADALRRSWPKSWKCGC